MNEGEQLSHFATCAGVAGPYECRNCFKSAESAISALSGLNGVKRCGFE
jgi:hypothetical protein